jgi:hypothetical protein
MWIFAKTGFYNVVIDAQNEGQMLIRCRSAGDAANLWRDYHEALPSLTEPISREDREYPWRMSISKVDFKTLAQRLATGVSYSNSKETCHREPSQRSNALLTVWRALWQALRDETHGNIAKRHELDDSAWDEFVAKLNKRAATKPAKQKRKSKAKNLPAAH